MPEVHGKNLGHSVAGVALESGTTAVTLEINNDVAEKTAAGALAKAYLEGIYGWRMRADYLWNPAAGNNDATIYAMRLSGAQTVAMTPGGGVEAADNPEYTGSALLEQYTISIPHDGIITSKAAYGGTGALTRDVTP